MGETVTDRAQKLLHQLSSDMTVIVNLCTLLEGAIPKSSIAYEDLTEMKQRAKETLGRFRELIKIF
jgi:hypothetical protein